MSKSADGKVETDSPGTPETTTAQSPVTPNDIAETDSPKTPQTTTTPPIAAGVEGDVENQTNQNGYGDSKIVQRGRKYSVLKKWSFALRVTSLLFSLLAFIIMASNKHGDWKDFDKYDEYKYVLAIAIISTFYTGLQALFQFIELSSGKDFYPKYHKTMLMLDFSCDQLLAYLLLSAASSAVPLANRMREVIDTIYGDSSVYSDSIILTDLDSSKASDSIFTDSLAAAISMEFIAFFTLALSALVSGYRLCNKSYI